MLGAASDNRLSPKGGMWCGLAGWLFGFLVKPLKRSQWNPVSPSPVLYASSFVIFSVSCFFRSLLWGLLSFTRWMLGSGLPGACLLLAGPDNFPGQFTQLSLAGKRICCPGSWCRWRHTLVAEG